MATNVLCVAEKPSIARAVASHLSGNNFQTHNIPGNPYVKNYEFHYTFPNWGACDVTMTSVLGHLVSLEFDPQYKSWGSCDPVELFHAEVHTEIASDKKPVAKNIETKARQAKYLYIWTDCDREGEHIGKEIQDTALKTNRQLKNAGRTVRARFSNVERAHIIQAAHNPITLDMAQANAVASRIELDLRIGASFTRNLTLTLQNMISGDRRLISYGSCQFPTLGFVVERYFRVRNFVAETFWTIKVMHEKEGINVNFRWTRTHLFDRMVVVVLFERCIAARTAKVTKVQTRPTSKWKPLPLTTVELQKCGSRFLRMDSQRVMSVAESLYQKGFLSYPRTETDQFDKAIDLRSLVQKQTQSTAWGPFAQGLLNGGFSQPRNGRNNDKAHPPIHPVTFVAPEALNTFEEKKVYEFVARRFLACCSEDARGSKTDIGILYGSETFSAYGLMVLERNYLDVYPYDKWTSSQQLPRFTEGEVFVPTEARIHEGKTSPPGYLTEPELISLMDVNGIGTDATMAQHITTIKQREYVETRDRTRRPQNEGEDGSDDDNEAPEEPAARGGGHRGGRGRRGQGRGGRGGGGNNGGGAATNGVQEFIPTTLGVALIDGYEKMGFEVSLAKPFLRKQMEQKMKAICDGQKTKDEVIRETIGQYRAVYMHTQERLELLRRAVRRYVLQQPG